MEACSKLLEIVKLSSGLPLELMGKTCNYKKQESFGDGTKEIQNEVIAELNDILGEAFSAYCEPDIRDFRKLPQRIAPERVNTNPIIFDERFIELESTLSTSDDSNSDTELQVQHIEALLYK